MVPISIRGNNAINNVEVSLGNIGYIGCYRNWSYVSWNSVSLYIAAGNARKQQLSNLPARLHTSTMLMYAHLLLKRP